MSIGALPACSCSCHCDLDEQRGYLPIAPRDLTQQVDALSES